MSTLIVGEHTNDVSELRPQTSGRHEMLDEEAHSTKSPWTELGDIDNPNGAHISIPLRSKWCCFAALPGNSGKGLFKDPEKIRQSLEFECADRCVFLLCALVMSKRERAGTATVVFRSV